MDISIFLIDIIAAIGMFMALFMLWTYLTFTEAGGCMPGYIVVIVITIVTFILLRSIRYPIALFSIGIFLIYYTFLFVTIFHPRQKLQQAQAIHYGQQIYDHLKKYHMIPLATHGRLQIPEHPELTEIYLFIGQKHYERFVHESAITEIRWEFFTAGGKIDDNDYPDRLYVALILEQDNSLTIALPFFAGYITRSAAEKKVYRASYVWSLALSDHYLGASIGIYPIGKQKPKPITLYREEVQSSAEQIKAQQHTLLDVPQFDLAELETYFEDTVLHRITQYSSTKVPHLRISEYRDEHDDIDHAIKLAQTD